MLDAMFGPVANQFECEHVCISGVYAPDCDAQGFYKATQCHNSVGVCWCVDKHGVEFANTRTRSKPNCG